MKKVSSYRFLLFFALAFLFAVNSYNQETETVDSLTQAVPIDDEAVEGEDAYYPDTLKQDYRAIDYDSVRAINNDKGFYYKKYMDSLLRAVEARLKNMEERRNRDSIRRSGQPEKGQLRRETYIDDSIFSGSGLGIIFWILAIALFAYIVFKMFLSNASFFSGHRKNTSANINVDAEEDTSDPDAMIRHAIKNGNYRLAVRYLYLQTLVRLSEKKFIRVTSNKTNYEYVKELRSQKFAEEFASLTLKYEYVWYGEYPVDEKLFEQIHGSFNQFNKNFLR